MRDLDLLQRMAASHGQDTGAYATALLDTPLPWTKMRQVYALLGLVKKWGEQRVDAACRSALDHEVVNVGLIGRMLERASETTALPPVPAAPVVPTRFARDPGQFALGRPDRPHPGIDPGPLRAAQARTEAGLDADLAAEAR